MRIPAFRNPRRDDHLAMTWVVGCGTADFGVLIGDIRVSFSDCENGFEERRLGVRKIHQVNPSIWVGFAGSIDLGFRMVRRLQSFARARYEETGTPPEPDMLVDAFVHREAARYAKFPSELRGGGCHLLVVGSRQQWVEHDSKRLFRAALCITVRFPFPGQKDVEMSPVPFNHFGSIGSGSGVRKYQQHLDDEVSDGKQGLFAFSPTTHPSFAGALPLIGHLTSLGLGSVIEAAPTLGISSQMHVAVVTPDGSYFGTNEGAELTQEDGVKRFVPPFPPIAESLEGFQLLLMRLTPEQHGIAIC